MAKKGKRISAEGVVVRTHEHRESQQVLFINLRTNQAGAELNDAAVVTQPHQPHDAQGITYQHWLKQR